MKVDFLGLVSDNKDSKDPKDNTVFSFAIDLRNITFNKSIDKYTNKLTALLIVIGEDGNIAHSSTNTVDVNFSDTQYKQFSKSWFFYTRTLSLKPGFYNVRFAIRDPINNRLGSVSGWVDVPNLEKAKLVLSNILLLHEEEHNKNKSVGEDSLSITGTGQAISIFSEKSSIGFLCYIFNATKAEKLTAQVEVLQNNKALFTSPQLDVVEKVDASGRITYSGKLPLVGFPLGRYRLRITINDRKNKVQAFQEQGFSIENN